MHKILPVLAAVLTAGLLTSCSTLEMQTWSDPDVPDRQLGPSIVLGVAASDNMRRSYEDMFANRLKEVGANVVASYSVLPDEDKLDEAEVRAAIKKAGVESVIVTRVVDERDKTQYVPAVSHGGYYGYYSYGYNFSSGHAYNYTETHLETNVYDVETEKLVWAGRMVVTDHKSDKKNMKDVVAGQVKEWQKAGMLGVPAKK